MKKLLALIYLFVIAAANLAPLTANRAVAANGPNLISNPSVETADPANSAMPQDWSTGGWGTNTRSLTYVNTPLTGSKAIKAQITSYTDGDAKWYFKPVAVQANTQYTYTDNYQANVATGLIAQYDDGAGHISYADLGSPVASPSTWNQATATFTTPATAKSMTIFHLINKVGQLVMDDVSLTEVLPVTPPTATMTAPGANSTVSGNSVALSANASDSQGVAGVQFQVDGNNVGAEDTTAPYTINWDSTTVSNGSHNISAVARNTNNLTGASAPITVTVNNDGGTTPPGPVTSNLVLNPGLETADPANSAKPDNWASLQNGNLTAAYSYLTTGHSGSRSIKTQVTKRSSGQAGWQSTTVSIKPNVTYNFSFWYQSNATAKVTVTVNRANGTTNNPINTSLSSSTAWKQFTGTVKTPADAQSVKIYVSLDRVGQLVTDDFDLELPVTAPTVSLTSPTANSTLSGIQDVTANASDSQGIASVQFKLDGNNLGSADTTSPYSYSWNTANVADGSHTLTAVATNIYGMTTTSAPVTISVTNTAPPSSSNLIANPSAESPDSQNPALPAQWSNNKWGTNTAQFSYATSGHTGSRSLKTQITSYTSGDAKWYFAPVNVSGNQNYTYVDYYQSNVATDVVAASIDANGNYTYIPLGSAAASSGWSLFTNSFTTPANAKQVTVYHVISKVGTLSIDDASLIVTPAVPATDMIPNNSLETPSAGNGSLPALWTKGQWGNNNAQFEYMNEGHSGTHSVKVTVSNYVDGDAKWYFNPVTSLTPGKFYRFSTWYKTNALPHVVAMFNMSDGTTKFFGMPSPQPSGSATTWQYYSDTFDVPSGATSVSAFMFMPSNGWVQVDDQSLADYSPTGWNRPLVSLTFDDGYEDNVTTVLPVLNQYGFKSTQCYETMDVEGNQQAINDVKSFYNSGHEVCAHTVTHPHLTQVAPDQLTYELTHSQQVLQGITGTPVTDFASPYGDYNQAVNSEIAKYFRSHRTVDEGYNSKDNFNIYRLRVQNMTPTTSLAQYQYWLDKAKATNTWLILVYHRVASSGLDPFDTYAADFKQQMAALNNSGLTVKTWSAALDELVPQL